jgi:hypothetical protein
MLSFGDRIERMQFNRYWTGHPEPRVASFAIEKNGSHRIMLAGCDLVTHNSKPAAGFIAGWG